MELATVFLAYNLLPIVGAMACLLCWHFHFSREDVAGFQDPHLVSWERSRI